VNSFGYDTSTTFYTNTFYILHSTLHNTVDEFDEFKLQIIVVSEYINGSKVSVSDAVLYISVDGLPQFRTFV